MNNGSNQVTFTQAVEMALQHYHAGRLAQAEAICREVLRAAPDHPDALHLLGVMAFNAGKKHAALTLIERAIAANSSQPLFLRNSGEVLRSQGRLQEAMVSYRKALALEPEFAETYFKLGNVLREQGNLDEALASYCKATELKPDYLEAYTNRGNLFNDQGRFDEAIGCYQNALASNPECAEAHNGLGVVFNRLHKFDDAMARFRKALELKSDYAEAHSNLGVALKETGHLAEAVNCYRRALDLRPDLAQVYSNLLLTLNYHFDCSVEELYQEHIRFAERFEGPLRDGWKGHANLKDPVRRLTVGYVSPDFREHPVSMFLEPVLSHHDRSQIRVIAYSNTASEDTVTGRVKERVDVWRRIDGMGDEEVTELVRRDGVDILVDLAGHTAYNRILIFARKPAPVQVSWLGYPTTTGLSAMDYRLTDPYAEVSGQERYYTEELVYLPDGVWCYPELGAEVGVNALPAMERGGMTFGSFNNFAKIGPEVLSLWVKLLKSVAGSRLLIARVPEGAAREQLLEQFAACGIAAKRIELLDGASRVGYLKLFNHVDIALDPFPLNGATTTCDALWMGVPVITLAGDRFVSRLGVSLLSAAGLADWVARGKEKYIELAREWSEKLPELARLRAGLREQLRASPLMDAERFARNLDAAYRSMWQRYCHADGLTSSRNIGTGQKLK